MKQIAVLNYGLGNVRSVSNALAGVGAKAYLTDDPRTIQVADALVIPGVGAFPKGMECLISSGLNEEILNYALSGRPILGICLGMQLLFKSGNEFVSTKGLGLIDGDVSKIPLAPHIGRLPHICWSEVNPTCHGAETIFKSGKGQKNKFYFVHSFAATAVPTESIGATVRYCGLEIIAAVQKGNIWGTQFHPEKSGRNGLELLRGFVESG